MGVIASTKSSGEARAAAIIAQGYFTVVAPTVNVVQDVAQDMKERLKQLEKAAKKLAKEAEKLQKLQKRAKKWVSFRK